MICFEDTMYQMSLENGFLYYTQEPVYKNKSYKNVAIHKFVNPSVFYVTVNEKWEEIRLALDDAIDDFLRYFGEAKRLRRLSYGMPVMAPRQADPVTYARGQIVNAVGHEVFVNLIDHGSIEPVDRKSLRMIPKNLLAIPKLLYSCRLHNVVPSVNNMWEEMNWMEFFQEGDITLSFVSESDFGVYDVVVEVNKRSFGVTLMEIGVGNPVELKTVQVTGHYPTYDYSVWENSKVPAFGVSVVSMEVAWFQLQTQFLCAINEIISNHIETMTEMQKNEEFSKHVGDPCLVSYADNGLWHRGHILEVRPPGSYKVRFVDYGNDEIVTDAQITKIPENLVNIPKVAVEVNIVDVSGIQGLFKLAKLKALVEGADLVVRVEDAGRNTCDKERLLLSVWQKDGTSLSTHFPRPRFAVEDEPMGFRIASDTFSHLMAGETTKFYPGTEFTGVVSCVENLKSVWLQLDDSEDRALSMFGEMRKFYSNSKLKLSMNQRLIQSGAYCVAQQSSDSEWYRALIKKVTSTTVKVLYIDYGNEEHVPISCLKPLISYFARERCLAVEVDLGIPMPPNTSIQDEEKICDSILDLTAGRRLCVELTKVDNINKARVKVDIRDILLPMDMFHKTNFMGCNKYGAMVK